MHKQHQGTSYPFAAHGHRGTRSSCILPALGCSSLVLGSGAWGGCQTPAEAASDLSAWYPQHSKQRWIHRQRYFLEGTSNLPDTQNPAEVEPNLLWRYMAKSPSPRARPLYFSQLLLPKQMSPKANKNVSLTRTASTHFHFPLIRVVRGRVLTRR